MVKLDQKTIVAEINRRASTVTVSIDESSIFVSCSELNVHFLRSGKDTYDNFNGIHSQRYAISIRTGKEFITHEFYVKTNMHGNIHSIKLVSGKQVDRNQQKFVAMIPVITRIDAICLHAQSLCSIQVMRAKCYKLLQDVPAEIAFSLHQS